LDDFEAHWPVDDVLRGNFNNRTSYRKDRDNGALARRRGAHKDGQGGGDEGTDIGGEDGEGDGEDETGRGGDGYDYGRLREVGNETSDEGEDDLVQRWVSGRKTAKVLGA
jgi:hypothetical protein